MYPPPFSGEEPVSRIQPDLLRAEDFPVVFGRYTLLGLLGEGGMARVFRAELQGPSGFRKAAAVKIIRASVAARSEALRVSLINEARLGGLLHHPNIVDTYDYGEVDDLPYIAMELVRGIGLDQVLSAVRPLPAPLAVELAAQICAGLDHAHNLEDAGVDTQLVHRDLKPSNVIVSRDGLVKVMDFGIAKATMISEGNTQTGMTKGTPAYMSPEQVAGEDLDPRSDLFAMGAILYELVTGERLFNGDSIMSVLMGVVRVEERMADPAVLDLVEERAPGMGAIIQRCLKKEREERFDDAADLEHALRLVARRLPPPPPLKKWVRELMKAGGIGAGDPSSGSLPASPALPSPPPSPVLTPAAAAPHVAPREVNPTLQMATSPPVAPGPPPPPPRTPPEVAGPTRAQIASLEQVPARGGRARRRPPAKRTSPLLLLLLGLAVGGSAAGVAVLAWTAWSGDRTPSAAPVLEDLAVPPPPRPAPSAGETSARRPEPATTPIARPPEPAQPPASTPTPPPAAVERRPDPTPLPATRDANAERERVLAERAAREEERRQRREAQEREARERETRRAGTKPAAVPDPRAVPDPSVPSPTSSRVPPPPVPAPDAGERFRIASASATPSRGEDGEVMVRFAAVVHGGDVKDVTVHFNPRGASWIAKPMRARDGKNFVVNIGFKERNQGLFYYYVTATDGSGAEVSLGDDDDPREAVAE